MRDSRHGPNDPPRSYLEPECARSTQRTCNPYFTTKGPARKNRGNRTPGCRTLASHNRYLLSPSSSLSAAAAAATANASADNTIKTWV